MSPVALTLPDVARAMLKGSIMSLANAGLITTTDAEYLVAILGLKDA